MLTRIKQIFLLVVTNSKPSPQCETRIIEWNMTNRTQVRVWRGYQLDNILRSHRWLLEKYGVLNRQEASPGNFQSILFEAWKITQSARVSLEFSKPAGLALDAASYIGELAHLRMSNINLYGRAAFTSTWVAEPEDWMVLESIPFGVEELSLTTISALLRYFTAAEKVRISTNEDAYLAVAEKTKLALSRYSISRLREVSSFTNIDIEKFFDKSMIFSVRK